MSKKDFIDLVEALLENVTLDTEDEKCKSALEYFENFKAEKPKAEFTENGAKILQWMKDNHAENLSAKAIGEELFMNSRSVSGAIRKLVSDGYVDKTDGNPKLYSITNKGLEKEIIIEEKENN